MQNSLHFFLKSKKGFTLVELIIVITILAILSVSAFLVVSQWIGKSRDSRRLSDLGTIQRALEVSLTENAKYPTPDSTVNITAGSIIIGQQGKFGDGARSATDIKTTPMDPLDNVAYTYYVATGGKNYQVMGFLENSSTLTFRGIEAQGPRSTVSDQENLQFSNSACTCNSNGTNSICSVAFFASLAFCLNYAHASEVSAADYSVRIPTVKGETLGILILSGTNQPVEELGSTVDLSTSTSSLIAIFSDTDKSIGTGGQIISPVVTKSKLIVDNPNISFIDPTLMGYRNMETLTSTGALRDFSKSMNHGVLGSGMIVATQAGVLGKSSNFFSPSHIQINPSSSFSGYNQITLQAWVNFSADPSGTVQEILQKWPGWTFGYNGSSIWFELMGSNASYIGAFLYSWKPIVGQWYLVTATYDGLSMKAYVDGKLLGDQSSAVDNMIIYNIPTNKMGIGIAGWDTQPFGYSPRQFTGLIDEVRIYNRALSDIEIQAIYSVRK